MRADLLKTDIGNGTLNGLYPISFIISVKLPFTIVQSLMRHKMLASVVISA